jgi:hypothetical protein
LDEIGAVSAISAAGNRPFRPKSAEIADFGPLRLLLRLGGLAEIGNFGTWFAIFSTDSAEPMPRSDALLPHCHAAAVSSAQLCVLGRGSFCTRWLLHPCLAKQLCGSIAADRPAGSQISACPSSPSPTTSLAPPSPSLTSLCSPRRPLPVFTSGLGTTGGVQYGAAAAAAACTDLAARGRLCQAESPSREPLFMLQQGAAHPRLGGAAKKGAAHGERLGRVACDVGRARAAAALPILRGDIALQLKYCPRRNTRPLPVPHDFRP